MEEGTRNPDEPSRIAFLSHVYSVSFAFCRLGIYHRTSNEDRCLSRFRACRTGWSSNTVKLLVHSLFGDQSGSVSHPLEVRSLVGPQKPPVHLHPAPGPAAFSLSKQEKRPGACRAVAFPQRRQMEACIISTNAKQDDHRSGRGKFGNHANKKLPAQPDFCRSVNDLAACSAGRSLRI